MQTSRVSTRVIVPGGFSYGDYLRCGAIARFCSRDGQGCGSSQGRHAGPGHLQRFPDPLRSRIAARCLTRNQGLHFICRDEWLTVEANNTAWSSRYEAGAQILIPLKSGEGRFQASEKVLDELEGEGRVVFRYSEENPNGSQRRIAGISSANGRVVGLMPHPEHATEALTGPSDDGLGLFYSALDAIVTA